MMAAALVASITLVPTVGAQAGECETEGFISDQEPGTVIESFSGILRIVGTSGDDVITVTPRSDESARVSINGVVTVFPPRIFAADIIGCEGDDRISVFNGDLGVDVFGDAGNDKISIGNNFSSDIYTGAGNDRVRAKKMRRDHSVVDNGGNDRIVLGPSEGNTTVYARDGKDFVITGATQGFAIVFLGSGNDEAAVGAATEGGMLACGGGTDIGKVTAPTEIGSGCEKARIVS